MEILFGLLKEYQMSIMFALSLICGMLAFFVLITKTLIPSRKYILLSLELCAMFMLIFDRLAYTYRGDNDTLGYWMVRISNFMVFALILGIIFLFSLYLINLFRYDGGIQKTPKRLKMSCYISALGLLMLIISQFTNFYYYFDEYNRYHRSEGFMVCYLIPLIILILDLSVILEYYDSIRKLMRISILMFSVIPLIASIIQLFTYGVSLTNITLVGLVVLLYVFALIDMNDMIERANKNEIEIIRKEQKNTHLLFKQTATALANAIDAKDRYTHGHSRRVAEYSVKVAKYAQKTDKECEELYFAALLHDVGKIGIKDSIINKEGKLTDEEYGAIKTHPVIGMQILSSISQSPYLSIGAHYHHERYDGHGYPAGLKGEDIPDIARIIAVADAYDAMTSKRSYRDTIPQQLVREEFVKGIGTQFDPFYARIMIHLIDLDSQYMMRETKEKSALESMENLVCESYRSAVSDGILITDHVTHIHLSSYMSDERRQENIPSFVLFDSLDERIHEDERKRRDLLYNEYAVIRADGKILPADIRNFKIKTNETAGASAESKAMLRGEKISFDIEAMRYKDHVLIRISNRFRFHEIIIALPDSTRYCYLSLTGEYCVIEDVDIAKTGEKIGEGYIPRIAEEISYINVPSGDIPNIQVDGWRSDSSEGIEVSDGMRLSFHSMSLPTARLVWHCPFVVLYTSDDGQVDGNNYRELTVVRLDGEGWEEDDYSENRVNVSKLESFTDWNDFKAKNKEGQDCELLFGIKSGRITISTEYCGLSICCVTTVTDDVPKLYTALTGDQCAITNIRINRE
ncbi:HD-GYP domain-containing protein [uncultured Ruminococcus sp.]|uniref:HD-GYP domain-containing protein n=1 Tax=uncultured Ruminococcus sp. TaxID=165186 RepID=UPI0025F9ECD1|nr:HD-GYP domain-containing protein [uncultured Ruminococcus sp.]